MIKIFKSINLMRKKDHILKLKYKLIFDLSGSYLLSNSINIKLYYIKFKLN
jgi:hypothetical protein